MKVKDYIAGFLINDFIICCGYKQHVIKEWFADYYLHNIDYMADMIKAAVLQELYPGTAQTVHKARVGSE